MTKMENILKLASKLNIDVKQIDDTTVQIAKPVKGLQKLAAKLRISVYISGAEPLKPSICQSCALPLDMKFLSVIEHKELGWVHQVCAWDYEDSKDNY